MKHKILIIAILTICAWLPIQAQAVEHNFPAGSIILPMDQAYQDDTDGGLLEVYGLVYYLLSHKDQACLNECAADYGGSESCIALCPEDITVNWVINDEKTDVTGIDLVIEDDTLPRVEGEVTIEEVVRLSDKNWGTTALTPSVANGDTAKKITYRGGLFIIDINDLDRADDEADQTNPALDDYAVVMETINSDNWAAVEVHIAQVPFAAPIHRRMQGTPPRIALMNDDEDHEGGNAEILEGYLQMAGICPDSYDVVTPLEIAGIYPDGGGWRRDTPILAAKGYDFMWAPHWHGADGDEDGNGIDDNDEIMLEIGNFLKSGKGLLGECASIRLFENNVNGHYLTDKGIGDNGGNANIIVYDDVTSPYAQIGDHGIPDPIGFESEGGSLTSWRPYVDGDSFKDGTPPSGNAVYNPTVTRFASDSTGWDYFVGGHAYGNERNGYVVYLGGHSYGKCDSGGTIDPTVNIHTIKQIEFTKTFEDEVFTLHLKYISGGNTEHTVLTFEPDDVGTVMHGHGDIEIDLTNANVKDNKKFEKIDIINTTGADITIDRVYMEWTGGNPDQYLKKFENDTTDQKIYEYDKVPDYWGVNHPAYDSDKDDDENFDALHNKFEVWQGPYYDDPWTIELDSNAPANLPLPGELGCTNNGSCEWKNLAAIRYILNTLFNIKYDLSSHEYVRAAPVVAHPWLYQGSFEWPSYRGHFRRYEVDQELDDGEDPVADWDSAGKVPLALTGNADSGARQVFTAKKDQDTGTWSLLNFDTANIDNLKGPLAHAADDPDSTEEESRIIERLRGLTWNWEMLQYEENPSKLGAIMHSAPVIIRGGDKDSRFAGRSEVAYVGDMYGMLHAINTSNGVEKWAYIPSNLLPKLQNDRTDVNATQDFAAVDGSPTAKDIYYDPDYNPDCVDEPDEDTCHRAENRSWHTVLICTQGFGGTSVFALDVTDPDNWEVLWEVTDTSAPGGGMGHAYRASLDRVKVPKKNPHDGTEIPGEYEPRWVVYVATSYAEFASSHGGINVFAFDLKTGEVLATFSSEYEDSVNDIPGAVTTADYDGDTFADRIFVGDMNGRLWELEAEDLSNPHGTVATGDDAGKQIPLFDAGAGNPISVSPAIVNRNGHVMVIFGTGGADWAIVENDKRYHIYAVDATAANAVIGEDKTTNYYLYNGSVVNATWSVTLDNGEKVWSSPTISAGQILVATAFGTMESADPRNDLDGGGKLRLLDLSDGSSIWKNEDETDKHLTIGKVRGSLYVSRGHVYMTDVDGTVTQIGNPDDYEAGTGNRVVLRSWRNQ